MDNKTEILPHFGSFEMRTPRSEREVSFETEREQEVWSLH